MVSRTRREHSWARLDDDIEAQRLHKIDADAICAGLRKSIAVARAKATPAGRAILADVSDDPRDWFVCRGCRQVVPRVAIFANERLGILSECEALP